MTIPPPPDWLDAGTDLLKEKIGDHAADLLEAGLAAIELMEANLAIHPWGVDHAAPAVAIIARARGETPDQTVARLAPHRARYDYDAVAVAPSYSVSNPWSDANAATPLADIRAMQDRIRWGPVGTEPENIYINGHQVPIVPGSLAVTLKGDDDTPDPGPIPHRRSTLAGYLGPKLASGHAAPRESRRRRRTP